MSICRNAHDFYRQDGKGDSFMAIGMKDPVLGPPVMSEPQQLVKGRPPAIKIAEAGHFVREWGAPIARAAPQHWGDAI